MSIRHEPNPPDRPAQWAGDLPTVAIAFADRSRKTDARRAVGDLDAVWCHPLTSPWRRTVRRPAAPIIRPQDLGVDGRRARYRGFRSSSAICDIVRRALTRAGINSPFKGAHLLRHSLATRMLRNGASLEDIGQILRHRHPETTQIYAKVDLDALRALAPAWPGGAA